MLGSLKKACAPAIAAVGGVLAIGSRIFDGKDMAELGLPFWAWEVIGAGIFFIAIGTIVVGDQRRIEELNQDSQVPSPHIGGESVIGTKDNPIVPEATLHIYIGAHDFGTSSGGGGFPNDPVDALWLRIYAVFNMANTVLLQSIWLKLDSIQIQSNGWIAKTDGGLLQQNHYFAIPHSISPGKHNAQMPVEADDKWWGSHSFRIEVPKR